MEWKTVTDFHSERINIKRSEFYATAFPVEGERDFREKLKMVSRRDATHNCWAYRIYSTNGILEHSSDDGEPSGTAGRPILGVLKKYDLMNVAIVVTRYFGGVKLGVRGLIEAYSLAAELAVKGSRIRNLSLVKEFEVEVSYSELNNIFRMIETAGLDLVKTTYTEKGVRLLLHGAKIPEGIEVKDVRDVLI
ncbi:YigZ family protein [Thermotoga sp. KOL6]|uniref:IMPACT family protein n=1 Tax=Thermotoga sp. KOL6 TaxID=126741 RepID=UPI000C783440|nr:YigZ family protein [Thermotoga sp. KOL6]PLV60098.1 X-Pro dipeptidase [Thermotoga sp. KOL6]